ncbi:winged helix-turn-helix domain-containing protein [Actinomadura sp. ATCC 31491]|uniref:Winged helix-turn-helix domain-containing protein n=1 Tax=Actinomadura luzonensis TaxID=2805427 RepID=A0ABT0G5T5_9ACTN|nr:BTAD domain-containing putative transcriptional regulator [Actinomadura luzonensis]MCK2219940.1 winged helix-turn-helix domain-containing protein [Actinomadura luzonensis]
MEFRIMGPLDVRDGDHVRTPTTPKHRDLLAMFLLNAGRPLTVERLRRLLWPREGGDRSDSLVRGYVGQLRQLLGKDVITTVSGAYVLAIGDEQVDVDRFRLLVDRGAYEEALALWRGPVLEDVDPDGERWVETRRLREELEELRLLALERRVQADLEAGRHRELLAELKRLTKQHPLWQRFRGQYMLALYRSGRRVEALAAYAVLRDQLDGGHAIEPDPELQLLYHRMLHDDVSLHVSAGPPVLLPPDIQAFTGRADLLDRVIGGQVVVHGQAGAGKSALAVHAAWRARASFPDGILYADLRETTAPAAVLEDFLRWLGCPAQAIPAGLEQRGRLFRTYTANRGLLVLLDNAADEAQVRPLLTSCPTVVTSRSSLGGLTGATRLSVGVLGAEESLELLTTSSGRPADDALRRLARFCGGLPIALRIAGSRLAARPSWTADYLVGLLEDEHKRLDGLHAGDQTVRSVFAIGYDGLPEPAKLTLRGLGALSAPDFADWLTDQLGGGAEALVDAGLLETHGVDVAGQVRYRLHDLTRLFAREQPLPGVLAKVSALALARVQASRFSLVSGDPATTVATRDIRESVEWLEAERPFLVSLVADLHEAGLDEPCWRLAHLLSPFLERHRYLDDWRAVSGRALESARRAGDDRGEALILLDQGDLRLAEREWDLAHERLRLALGMFLRQGRTREVNHTRRRLGRVHLERGRLEEAERALLACLEAAGNQRDAADAERVLGAVLRRAGRLEEAAARLLDAVERLTELGDRHRQADTLLDLSAVRLAQGAKAEARAAAERARGIAVRLGDRLLDAHALLALARVGRAEGAPGRAGELARAALEVFEQTGDGQGAANARSLLALLGG